MLIGTEKPSYITILDKNISNEPRNEKTCFFRMHRQKHRSAAQ